MFFRSSVGPPDEKLNWPNVTLVLAMKVPGSTCYWGSWDEQTQNKSSIFLLEFIPPLHLCVYLGSTLVKKFWVGLNNTNTGKTSRQRGQRSASHGSSATGVHIITTNFHIGTLICCILRFWRRYTSNNNVHLRFAASTNVLTDTILVFHF